MDNRQFVYTDNKLVYNQNYQDSQTTYVPPTNHQTLAYLTCQQEIDLAKEIMESNFLLLEDVQNALAKIKTKEFAKQLHAKKIFRIDNNAIPNQLLSIFHKYGIPIGMLPKLLQGPHKRHFVIDDSGSMNTKTQIPFSSASSYIQHLGAPDEKLTRWQEAEDRMHKLIEILAYLPDKVTITFLNRTKKITLDRSKSPEESLKKAHAEIREAFKIPPERHHLTPSYAALKKVFSQKSACKVYFLTDGKPKEAGLSDEEAIEHLKELVRTRGKGDPSKFPLNLLPCSDEDADIEWMNEFEDEDKTKETYVAVIDDPVKETAQVNARQGYGVVYNYGIWYASNLEAASDPHGLDKLDDKTNPFTKKTFDEFYGMRMTIQAFYFYLTNHPVGKNLVNIPQYYTVYCRIDIVAAQIDHAQIEKTLPKPGWTGTNAGQMYQPPAQQQQPQPAPYPTTPSLTPFNH